MHMEDDILNSYPIRKNRNYCPRKENNCGDDSTMFLIDNYNLCDTIIADNTDLSSNNIIEIT